MQRFISPIKNNPLHTKDGPCLRLHLGKNSNFSFFDFSPCLISDFTDARKGVGLFPAMFRINLRSFLFVAGQKVANKGWR